MDILDKKHFSLVINSALQAANMLGPNNVDSKNFKTFIAFSDEMSHLFHPLDIETIKNLAALKEFANNIDKTAQGRNPPSYGNSQFF